MTCGNEQKELWERVFSSHEWAKLRAYDWNDIELIILVWVTVAMMKHHDQKQLEREGLFKFMREELEEVKGWREMV